MSTLFSGEPGFDFSNAAFAVISGAISGTTPKVSGWMRVNGVASVAFVLTTTSTANGVWTAEVATDYHGANAVAVPAANVSPAFPTGTSQNTTSTITIPERRYTHLRLTFTPSAGAGNANADTGLITGRAVKVKHRERVGVLFSSPGTQAGAWTLEYAAVFYDPDPPLAMSLPTVDDVADLPVYVAAIDTAQAAITIASPAGSATSIMKRLGFLEFAAVRTKFLPTAGAGRLLALFNSKG